jgi:hypothetical protein
MTTDLNQVRALIGDTDTSAQLLTNEIINKYLTDTANVYLAAMRLVRGPLKAAFLRAIDRSGTKFSASRSQINQHCDDLYENIKEEALTMGSPPRPYWGGTSDADAETMEDVTDFLEPTFKSGQHNND